MKLTREEMENIVSYEESSGEADVYTHSGKLIRQLAKYAAERPQECRLARECHDGAAVEYTLPKSWLKIKPPRTASAAQRAAAVAALAKARSAV